MDIIGTVVHGTIHAVWFCPLQCVYFKACCCHLAEADTDAVIVIAAILLVSVVPPIRICVAFSEMLQNMKNRDDWNFSQLVTNVRSNRL